MVGSSELGGTENQDLYLHYQIEKGKDGAAPMKALWCGRLTLDEAKHILNENGGNAEKIKDNKLRLFVKPQKQDKKQKRTKT